MIQVAVEINGETLNLQVDPGAVTKKMTDQAQRLELAGNTVPLSELPDVTIEQMNFLCGVLATLIKEWDLFEADGTKAPITQDFISNNLPYPVLVKISQAVIAKVSAVRPRL
jgi:hypothetical protein